METLDYLNEIRINLDDPEKVNQILTDELDKRLFEYYSWDIERMLFIEKNQE